MKIYTTEGNLAPDVADVLYELGNAGTGMVSITIGHLLNVRISISVPVVTTLDLQATKKIDMDTNRDAIAIFMHTSDAISGDVVFVMDQDFIVKVIEKLTGESYTFESMMEDDCGFSAVQEFGNILGAAYIKAIGSYTGIRLFLSPIMVGVDKVDKLLTSEYLRSSANKSKNIYVESEFTMIEADGRKIGQSGHIVLMPEEQSVQAIVDALGL